MQQSNVNFKQQFKDETSWHESYLNESCLNIFSVFSKTAVFSFKESGSPKAPGCAQSNHLAWTAPSLRTVAALKT